MRRFLLCCLVVLLPAVCLDAAEGKTDPVIVTLDFEAYLKNATLHTRRYTALQAELDRQVESFKEMDNRNKKIETRIGMTQASDPGYDQLVQDLEAGRLRLKIANRQVRERLEVKKKQMLDASIRESVALLEAFCNEKGYDVVIQTGGTEADREVPIINMPVLYSNPAMDITDDFLAYANAHTEAAAGNDSPGDSAPVLESIDEGQQ